ncbi:hypothetical protein CAPTEDRAFT_188659 [Capitella teleta]|uniref:Uncharacterized protein n=1 Tax=Capitella teleta TaxID=283909 RepID=R7V7X4_CAPTE|nr:hypothetical protein CAPTEDRAFT_188659 [Capitella teleta]|eukprot:ELU11850.1 hypothetical protein CAPTEDRAFT_188659 [Capitella teleta]
MSCLYLNACDQSTVFAEYSVTELDGVFMRRLFIFVTTLCEKVDHPYMPKNASRMGRKSTERICPMMVTFGSNLEARTFKSRCKEAMEKLGMRHIRVRSCRTKNDGEAAKAAKEEGGTVSFSLRDNGQIWRFTKDGQYGDWRRDTEWSDSPSGNGQ